MNKKYFLTNYWQLPNHPIFSKMIPWMYKTLKITYLCLQNSLKIYLREFWVRCTLRSWVHKMLSHYKSVSPRLGENCVSTCSSDSFPHTKYMSTMRGKPLESHFDVSLFSNPGKKVWKARKTMRQICPPFFLYFMTFFLLLETNDALQCSSDSFPGMVIYILCV